MEHRWVPRPPVRFHQEDTFTECSIECAECGALVPPDWPDDFMTRLAWDVPESCPGKGFVQPCLLSKVES